jgi:hypothetical protein
LFAGQSQALARGYQQSHGRGHLVYLSQQGRAFQQVFKIIQHQEHRFLPQIRQQLFDRVGVGR